MKKYEIWYGIWNQAEERYVMERQFSGRVKAATMDEAMARIAQKHAAELAPLPGAQQPKEIRFLA